MNSEQLFQTVASKKKELIKVGSAVLGAVVGVVIATLVDGQNMEEAVMDEVTPK